MARILKKYRDEVRKELKTKFEYANTNART